VLEKIFFDSVKSMELKFSRISIFITFAKIIRRPTSARRISMKCGRESMSIIEDDLLNYLGISVFEQGQLAEEPLSDLSSITHPSLSAWHIEISLSPVRIVFSHM
jgi:hypothetical protein